MKDLEKVEYKGESYTKDELIDLLLNEVFDLENENDELKNKIDDMNENYIEKPFNPYEEYGVSERDFI